MKINIQNTEKIIEMLSTAQRGCSTRKIDIVEIQESLEIAEIRLSKLPVKMRIGNICILDTHVEYAKSCSSKKSNGTLIKLIRGNKSWFMVKCERTETWCYEGVNHIILTEQAVDYMVEQYRIKIQFQAI